MRPHSSFAVLVLLCLGMLPVLPGSAGAAEEFGSISGAVTGEGTLQEFCVEAYDATGTYIGGDYYASSTYVIDWLPAGQYLVHFLDCGYPGDHVSEWYQDAADREAATPVEVVAGADTGGIDAVLGLGGSISGTLTDEAGDPVFGCVEVFDASGQQVGWADAQEGGAYRAGGLRSGTYAVRVDPCGGWGSEQQLGYEWYADRGTRLEADPVIVVQGQDTPGIDASLPPGGAISGTVTRDDGTPLRYVCVEAHDASGEAAEYAYTNRQGAYVLDELRAGAYTIRFHPCGGGNHAPEWYADAIDRASAAPVAVAAGQETFGINASLAVGGIIRGRVADAAGRSLPHLCVDGYDAAGETVSWGFTNKNGIYRLRGLPAGEHRVGFSDCQGPWREGGAFRPEFHADRSELSSADPVPVAPGDVIDGVDAVLHRPGTLLLETETGTGVAEGGFGDAYSVMLGAPPAADVTVTLTTDGQTVVTPSTLSFTPDDWDAPQDVAVVAVDDGAEEGDHRGSVRHSITSADPEFDGNRHDLDVAIEDDDLVPDAVTLVYDGDTTVVRGRKATLSATLTDAATGESIEDRMVRIELGGIVVMKKTDEEGSISAKREVDLPYGVHVAQVSSAGNEWYLPGSATAEVQVAWEFTFADGDRAVKVNPVTRELQFVAPGDTSEIKERPAIDVRTIPTGHRIVSVEYRDDDLTVELVSQPETGAWAAAVKTAANAYALKGVG